MTHKGSLSQARAVSTRNSPLVIIENVEQAPLRRDLLLCGEMFGLAVLRHRIFETHGFRPRQKFHPRHRGPVKGWKKNGQKEDGPYYPVYGDGGGKGTIAEWQGAMGIDWTRNKKSLAEAIPPAYTQYIGEALANHLRGATAQVKQ
jgi:DNA (cytosine-5)-methyltransferase 1